MHEQHNIIVNNKWVSAGGDYPAEKNSDFYTIHFDTMSAYLDHVKNSKRTLSDMNASKTGSESFTGTKSFNEAVQFAEYGSPEHRDKFLKAAKNVEAEIGNQQVHMKTVEYGVAGAVPDIGRYVSGSPDYMATPRVRDAMPVIKILFNISVSASIKETTIYNVGAALLSVIQSLESKQGASVELRACEVAHGDRGVYCFTYPLKEAGKVLDIDHLAFQMCSASALRRLGFKVTETIPCKRFLRPMKYGYGRPAAITSESLAKHDNLAKTGDVIIPNIHRNMSASEAWEFVKKSINESDTNFSIG